MFSKLLSGVYKIVKGFLSALTYYYIKNKGHVCLLLLTIIRYKINANTPCLNFLYKLF